jgi:cytidylate kinase
VTLVTVSASFGAGGSWVGPELARRLAVPFLDRAIPAAVAERLAVPLAQVLAADERGGGTLDRFIAAFAPMGAAWGAPPEAVTAAGAAADYRRETERVIREHADEGSGVVLGRGAAVVLRDHPRAVHVRLDGPESRRVTQAMTLEEVDRPTAERMLKDTDHARSAYVQRFYGVDARDPALYHLVIDSTSMALPAVIGLILDAVAAKEAHDLDADPTAEPRG